MPAFPATPPVLRDGRWRSTSWPYASKHTATDRSVGRVPNGGTRGAGLALPDLRPGALLSARSERLRRVSGRVGKHGLDRSCSLATLSTAQWIRGSLTARSSL